MKHYLILFSVVIFCFSSCNFSYSSKTQHKQKKKQIDGKEYSTTLIWTGGMRMPHLHFTNKITNGD